MHRRDFLRTTGAAALAAGAVPAAGNAATLRSLGEAQQAHQLSLATPWADAVTGPGDHIRRFAARLARSSGGRWNIAVETRAADAGAATFTAQAVSDMVRRDVAFAWFGALPGGANLSPAMHSGWMRAGGGQALLDELAADHDMQAYLVGHTGPSPSLWSRVPLDQPRDFAGRRVAVSGLARDVVAALGAIAVDIAPDARVQALATGTIDIAEAPDASLATQSAFAATGANGYAGGLHDGGTAILLTIAAAFWANLDAAEHTMIATLAADAYAESLAEHAAECALAARLPGLIAPLAPLTPAVQGALSAVAQSIVAEAAGGSAFANRCNRSAMSWRGLAVSGGPLA